MQILSEKRGGGKNANFGCEEVGYHDREKPNNRLPFLTKITIRTYLELFPLLR